MTRMTGIAIGHLAQDPELMDLSGQVHVVADLASRYGFTDIDGKQPVSLAAR